MNDFAHMRPLNRARWPHSLLAVACLVAMGCLTPGVQAQSADKPTANQAANSVANPIANPPALKASRREPVTLNFVNAEIEAVARTLATLSGANVVVDPRVKGTLSLSSNVPVPPAQALRLFAAQLRTQGFALVESAGLYTVVPEAEAKLQSSAVSAGAVPGGTGQIVTQIFKLNHENVNNLVPVLRPLISPNNTINVNPGTNALVITDYSDNLQRLGRIIAALDVSNATGVEVLRLRHAIAGDLAPMVQRLIESGAAAAPAAQGQTDNAFKTTVIPEVRTNALIVRAANPARLALVRSLVDQLDQPSATGAGAASGNIHVVYLKNADATKLATTLRAAIAGESRSGAVTTPGTPAAAGAGASTTNLSASAQPSTGGQIQADPATNALIITAPEPQYRQLRSVIDMLDQRRAQVFVESLIAEVSADKAAEFGVQWMSGTGTNGSLVGLLGTNFAVGGTNLLSLAAGAASGNYTASTGLNLAVGSQRNGVLALGALARFLQSNGDANVLSTPNLLTLDNEEAKIVIGQNVPFVTGSFAAASVGTTNPFTTIERKDVGLTLRVRPQISENGTIKMQVYQEVSNVDAKSIGSKDGLITNKRSIETNVLVDDGAIVVLGGLLQDDTSISQEKVPGLGDVPFFGNLFKSEARSRKKTNLMVFLRPVVVRDGAAVEALSMGRYEQMRLQQQGFQPLPTGPLPVAGSAVMPPLDTTAPAATPPTVPATRQP
jgi:general secretion pathway protein D